MLDEPFHAPQTAHKAVAAAAGRGNRDDRLSVQPAFFPSRSLAAAQPVGQRLCRLAHLSPILWRQEHQGVSIDDVLVRLLKPILHLATMLFPAGPPAVAACLAHADAGVIDTDLRRVSPLTLCALDGGAGAGRGESVCIGARAQ